MIMLMMMLIVIDDDGDDDGDVVVVVDDDDDGDEDNAEDGARLHQEPLYTEIYRRNDGAQNRGRHFVRAFAVQMHVQISQEPLYTEIYRKNAVAQNEPRTLSASLRSRNACQDFTRATLCRTLQKKCRRPKPHPTLRASLRSLS